jgi:hypothetical protein
MFFPTASAHRVADWYDRPVPTTYPFIRSGFHCSKLMLPQSLRLSRKAGEQALRHYANEEAVEFFSEALQQRRGQGAEEC